MINKYRGETILFQSVVQLDGTGVSNAVGSLSVWDYTGSQVANVLGTYQGTGTYQHSANSNAYGTGVMKYQWTIKTANGTNIDVRENEINLIGTTSNPESYIKLAELHTYYPVIEQYIDDTSESYVQESFKYINRMLENLNYKTPLLVNSDGLYDQSLRDMNAYFALYRIVASREIDRSTGDEKKWYKEFEENAMGIYNAIKKGIITFQDQLSPAEVGVQRPTRTVGSSVGTLVNNFDGGYGDQFKGSDYPRTWSVTINGTGTVGNLPECSYTWSNDGGVNSTTGTCSYDWQQLQDEVWIRFTRGTSTGTTGIMVVGDKWQFTTTPVKGMRKTKNVASSSY